jgi:hypothetical protein
MTGGTDPPAFLGSQAGMAWPYPNPFLAGGVGCFSLVDVLVVLYSPPTCLPGSR